MKPASATYEPTTNGATMDWRLIAALSSAGGSFCLVAIGAYAVFSANPGGPPPGRFAAAPMLLSEQRPASAAGSPVLVSVLGSSTGSSTQSSCSPGFARPAAD